VDIHEYTDRFELYVDIPGVNPSSVELTLEDGVLTLSGERAQKTSNNGAGSPQFQRIERSQGQFHRRFVLPDTVDSDKVNATGKDGVLTVTIPKQAKALPRRIQIAA
jgi:HSP20 family protein